MTKKHSKIEQTSLNDTSDNSNWNGVFAISLCVFALIASEFMPVSLLTPLAHDLGITEGTAGQGMTISGVFAVFTSLSIRRLAGTLNRKFLLLALTALMGLSAVLVALAPNYLIYMLGRAMIGVVIGGFWSMSVATAVRLVHISKVPRALAVFNGGNALATVVAAPLGSYLTAAISWRGAFLCLVPVAIITFVWQWISLPSMEPGKSGKTGSSVTSLLRKKNVAVGMCAAGIFFMGQFTLFTYNRLYQTLVGIPLVMASVAVILIPMGNNIPTVCVLLGLWGVLSTAAPVGWWSWVASATASDTESGGGLMVATVQFSIALGSTVGGILFDQFGFQSTFALSAGILIFSAILTLWTSKLRTVPV